MLQVSSVTARWGHECGFVSRRIHASQHPSCPQRLLNPRFLSAFGSEDSSCRIVAWLRSLARDASSSNSCCSSAELTKWDSANNLAGRAKTVAKTKARNPQQNRTALKGMAHNSRWDALLWCGGSLKTRKSWVSRFLLAGRFLNWFALRLVMWRHKRPRRKPRHRHAYVNLGRVPASRIARKESAP